MDLIVLFWSRVFVLFEPYVRFHIFCSVRVAGWPPFGGGGGGCSLGLRCVFLVYVPKCHFSFSHPSVYGVGISF